MMGEYRIQLEYNLRAANHRQKRFFTTAPARSTSAVPARRWATRWNHVIQKHSQPDDDVSKQKTTAPLSAALP